MKWQVGQRYGNRQTEVVNEDGQCVAVVWTHRPTNPCAANSSNFQPDPELMANYNLIVAAPELLEACKALIDRMDIVRLRGYVGHELVNSVRAAIAKATS